MYNYTDISDEYPINEKDFIRGYTPVKDNYCVTLAKGSKLIIPKTKEQKIILDEKLTQQINAITKKDLQSIEEKISKKSISSKISLILLLISLSMTFIPELIGIAGITLSAIFGVISISNIQKLNKEKALYEDILKNKTIVKDSELINSLLQIKNLTVRKDISCLFDKKSKKVINSFIKNNKKSTINNLQFISLDQLLDLKEAAIKYKDLKETYDKYDEFSTKETDKVKVFK